MCGDDTASTSVEARFGRPMDVVSATALTVGERVGLLEQWDELVQSRIRSSGEGMPARAEQDDVDAALAAEIAQALRMLNAVDPSKETASTAIVGVSGPSR